jgi:tight adherence protein C
MMGLALGYGLWTIMKIWWSSRDVGGDQNFFERERRARLRERETTYRWFEPLIDEFAVWYAQGDQKRLNSLEIHLGIVMRDSPWKPEEFLATKTVEGAMYGTGIFAFLLLTGNPMLGLVFGLPILFGYPELNRQSVEGKAKKRLHKIRARLPFMVDLLALMLEAGGGFIESLTTAVKENRNHPVGEEFDDVLNQIEHGRVRADAMRSLEMRLRDEDISELVFAIVKGDELGTPMSKILRTQADQMRLKRTQRGEQAAGEAQVKMVFPGMIVMIACLLAVSAPIILPLIGKAL